VDVTLLCTLAEAAAKAGEHAALLRVLHTAPQGDGQGSRSLEGSTGPDDVFAYRMGETEWFVTLAEARQKTGEPHAIADTAALN
jgi:hypothetical protein